MHLLLFWLLVVNICGAAAAIHDKRAAVRGAWRVSERTLFLLCILGGCPGVYLAMRAVHHKTKHRRFMWGIPAIFLIQCAICAALWYYHPMM